MNLLKIKKRNKEQILIKEKERFKKKESYFIIKNKMRKRLKNSQIFTNVKGITEDGMIKLKTDEVATVIELKAIDLSLASRSEKQFFFYMLKSLYQIKGLTLKCYKLDRKINLNNNKINLSNKMEKFKQDLNKHRLLEENKNLLEELENNHYTVSSIYYLVVIAKNQNILEKQLEEIEEIVSNVTPKLNMEIISNRLEIYKFLTDIYMNPHSLDDLIWSDLPSLISPLHLQEKTNMIKIDDKEIQMATIKNIPPFVDELFFEEIFNVPNVRACISIKDTISQDELIRWVNSQYQFLLSDRNTTRKLSDATELDTQKENFQQLMLEIKNGNEKIKEVSLTLVITGTRKEREDIFRDLKRIVERYQIKLDIPKLRQMECWHTFDITSNSLKDYSIYLPTLTLSAGFPFTKTYFNDDDGYMLGIDLHTSLPVYFDPFVSNEQRTSHNLAIISSTGGGKSFTMKKMIINEFARGTKIFIFDAENEYKKLVTLNGGEYIDLYSKKGGIINPLQIRYIPSDDEEKEAKETDCPLAKHLGFLEAFFKTAFEDITEKELVMLLAVVESLYNLKGIFKNTSINTLQSLRSTDYPIFSELYNYLPVYKESLNSKEKKRIIDQLEILVSRFLTGTDAFLFDGHTNIDLSNDLIAFNLQELLYSGNQRLINTQTLNLITYLNNSIVANKIQNEKLEKQEKKHISIIVDEFHLFIDEKNNEVLKNFGQLARRVRKYNTNLIVSTQSIKDFVGNSSILRHATAIFNNCQYTMVGMLKEDDLLAYLELFKDNPLTDTQKSFLLSSKRGEFLLNIDNKNRIRVWIRATELEKKMMGEN